MARTAEGHRMENGTAEMTIGSGDTDLAVSYPGGQFTHPPAVLVVPTRADAGTYSAESVTATGFTVRLASTDLATGEIVRIPWIAHEKT